jgi:hypothetical protein
MSASAPSGHSEAHAFTFFNARKRDGLTVTSRRSSLLRMRAEAGPGGKTAPGNKAVILLWMTGGPSHIDTWDVKPDMPSEIRGPFADIPTRIPGVHICEYLPKQAAMMDRFTLIRSVDCRFSNHEPNTVMQSANLKASPRTNPKGHLYPGIGWPSYAARIITPCHRTWCSTCNRARTSPGAGTLASNSIPSSPRIRKNSSPCLPG